MKNNRTANTTKTINGFIITYHEENGLYYPDLALPEKHTTKSVSTVKCDLIL